MNFPSVFKLRALAVALGVCLVSVAARADVRLPAMFTDHAVLQRRMEVPVWGWANPGETVTVSINGQKATATADADGKWSVKLRAMEAGGPYSLVVEGKNKLEVKDILVGEVWLCSGQSNMEWSLSE